MQVFIDFWKLETENSILHVFSFLHKLNFENSFCFLLILSYQTSFLVLKIENYFWKQKIRIKNSYQTYPYSFSKKGKKGRKWMNGIIVKLYIISFPFFLYKLPNTLEKIHHVFHSIPFLRKRLPNTVLIEWCQCCVLFIFLTL